MILITKGSIPVSDHTKVYQSVMPAWKAALESTEKLTSGMPQAANYGPCLLAISSWHLYPDIIVTGKTTVSHTFDDPLIRPGGALTLGLTRPGDETLKGVFWSLSLAHLNFYTRRPAQKKAVMNFQTQKLSFPQFALSIFGAFLARWGAFGEDAEAPARVLVKLRDVINNRPKVERSRNGSDNWTSRSQPAESRMIMAKIGSQAINILARAADTFLEAQEFGDDLDLKLIALGGKKAERVFSQLPPSTFMGLGEPQTLLSLLKGPEERITLLRRILSDSNTRPLNGGTYLIRFSEVQNFQLQWASHVPLGIATARLRREALPGGGYSNPPHVLWAPRAILQANRFHKDVVHEMSDYEASQLASKEFEFTLGSDNGDEAVPQTYHFIYGNTRCAGIYSNATGPNTIQPGEIRSPNFQDLMWCLEFDLFDIEALVRFLDLTGTAWSDRPSLMTTPEGPALRALGMAHQIYQSLPTATVSTRALNHPLNFAQWAQDPSQSSKRRVSDSPLLDQLGIGKPNPQLSQTVAMSCVAWFEAGVDINPSDLERVFALAYEDSIYVSMNVCLATYSTVLSALTNETNRPLVTLGKHQEVTNLSAW